MILNPHLEPRPSMRRVPSSLGGRHKPRRLNLSVLVASDFVLGISAETLHGY
jgi:hypothetical protein